MSEEVKVSKKIAEGQLKDFLKKWRIRDSKSILTGGKQSSIPADVKEPVLVAIMLGDLVFDPSNGNPIFKAVVEGEADPVKVRFCRKCKGHNLRDLSGGGDSDANMADFTMSMISAMTGTATAELEQFDMADVQVLMGIASIINL